MQIAPEIAEVVCSGGTGGGLRLWDAALDLEVQRTRGLHTLARMMAHHSGGMKPCPLYKDVNLSVPIIMLNHILSVDKDILHLDMAVDETTKELMISRRICISLFKLLHYG